MNCINLGTTTEGIKGPDQGAGGQAPMLPEVPGSSARKTKTVWWGVGGPEQIRAGAVAAAGPLRRQTRFQNLPDRSRRGH